jgi:hypothetical protein
VMGLAGALAGAIIGRLAAGLFGLAREHRP